MQFDATGLRGLLVVRPQRHEDERGYFTRTFCSETFAEAGLVPNFPQTSISYNRRAGTVRGMHFQKAPWGETKLVRCQRGAIHDVVVDLRPSEPTYLQAYGLDLTPENGLALYIPDGFAHGFQTLVDDTEVFYAITPSFVPGAGTGIRFDDPAIDLRWPLPVSMIADKDRSWPLMVGSR
jgi:dTDP-4-dehydrorhamnose 3,5-epimerase